VKYTYTVVFEYEAANEDDETVAEWLYGIEDPVELRFPDFGPNAGMEAKMWEKGFHIHNSLLVDENGEEI